MTTCKVPSWLIVAKYRAEYYKMLPEEIKIALQEQKYKALNDAITSYTKGHCTYEQALEFALIDILKGKRT